MSWAFRRLLLALAESEQRAQAADLRGGCAAVLSRVGSELNDEELVPFLRALGAKARGG